MNLCKCQNIFVLKSADTFIIDILWEYNSSADTFIINILWEYNSSGLYTYVNNWGRLR